MNPPNETGPLQRVSAALRAFGHRRAEHRAARAEADALLLVGAGLADAPPIAGLEGGRETVQAQRAAAEACAAAVDGSRAQDRRDWSSIPSWARGFVILRGVFERVVLRVQRRVALRKAREACAALGAAAFALPVESLPEHVRSARHRAEDARAVRTAAAAARAAELAPFAGDALPAPLRRATVELSHFGAATLRELKIAVVPRVSGLVGLGTGWLVAQTWTDSEFSATLHSLGLGSGPRRAVSSDALRAMHFWAPLLAAAICSYAGSRFSAWMRAKYDQNPAQPQP